MRYPLFFLCGSRPLKQTSKNTMFSFDGKQNMKNVDAILLHAPTHTAIGSTDILRKTIQSIQNSNGNRGPLIVYINKESPKYVPIVTVLFA